MPRRPIHRDDREYDQTALRAGGHARSLQRDYSAHFFRWSFARRYAAKTDTILDIGCGADLPLVRILYQAIQSTSLKNQRYVGVDLNRLPTCGNQHVQLFEEFNFVTRWRELPYQQEYGLVIHLEVLEHMHPRNGLRFLRACREVLRPGGMMIMSTPCYDGQHHAANHIHEYTTDELIKLLTRVGFTIEHRFGTFINMVELNKAQAGLTTAEQKAVGVLLPRLRGYFDDHALSCFLAPLLPEASRNNLWVCRR